VITITVPAIVITRSSNTNASHRAPTVALSREQGLPDIQRSLEPISAEIAEIARRSAAAGARHSSPRHTARHVPHRPVKHHQSISAADRPRVATSQTAAITAEAASTRDAITSTPAQTVTVTNTSPVTTTSHVTKRSSAPSQPPAYGEGGVLGAGHSG
jgi:hypothetical protein